jgi:hypothetical protein
MMPSLIVQSQPSIPNEISRQTLPKVVIFISMDCPITLKYIPLLNQLHDMYKGKIVFYGMIAGVSKSAEVERFINEYQIPFPVLSDKNYKWTKRLEASVTPEIFLMDVSNSIKYQGAIDNWFYDLGKYRQETTENYLTDAIQSLLAGDSIKIAKTEAIGCPIQVPGKARRKG